MLGISARRIAAASLLFFCAAAAQATIFGTVRGTVVDAQRRPVAGAAVTLQALAGQWQQSAATGDHGRYAFAVVPVGRYQLSATSGAFTPAVRTVEVGSGSVMTVDLKLAMPRVSEQISVSASAVPVEARSPTTQTTVSRLQIAQTPGASRANSTAIITDFVPGATMVHDQLHVRGGHQVTWMIDGIPVPNTNIGGNVGPQFDPKDIDYLEVQRGGLSAEYGDRTYAVFNVVPRTGFERSNESHLLLGIGTRRSTDDQFDLGSHTDRFAYYASLTGNRTDAGLEPPVAEIIHDRSSGAGLFSSLVFLPGQSDQIRVAASARTDSYEIPNDPELQALGVRDRQRERDAFVNTSWLHTVSPSMLLTVAPFFHGNVAEFAGGPADPVSTRDRRTSHYFGMQTSLSGSIGSHDVRFGVFGFDEHDRQQFALASGSLAFAQSLAPSGSVAALFAEDDVDVTPRLSLRAGVRWTHFAGGVHETAASPRFGASYRLPWADAVLRASYAQTYQPPPLATVAGPLESVAVAEGFGFLPLHGERDRNAEIGVHVPFAGWEFDADAFRNHARNFFDHDALGNSNIFLPLTIDRVRIRGIEATVASPRSARARFHLAFSHQSVIGSGGITGGLTDFEPPGGGTFFLDHDQRNTLSAGVTMRLNAATWTALNGNYGSGFLDGDGPAHLPSHATLDCSAGREFGDWSLRVAATNVTNRRYRIDRSNTFGGTHWADPREVLAYVAWRFHY